MTNPPRLTAASFGFAASRSSAGCASMERQAFSEDGVVTALEQRDETRLQRHALLAREVGRVAGATQQALHLARPIFSLDLDQRLQFAQMMGVAQRVQHTFQSEVGLPVVVHDNTDDMRQQAARVFGETR